MNIYNLIIVQKVSKIIILFIFFCVLTTQKRLPWGGEIYLKKGDKDKKDSKH